MKKIILLTILTPILLLTSVEANVKPSKVLLGDTYEDETFIKEKNSEFRIEKDEITKKVFYILETQQFKNDMLKKNQLPEKCIKELNKKQREIEQKYNIKFDTYAEKEVKRKKAYKDGVKKGYYKKDNYKILDKKAFSIRKGFKNKDFEFMLRCTEPTSLLLIPYKLENPYESSQLSILQKSLKIEKLNRKIKEENKEMTLKKITIKDYNRLFLKAEREKDDKFYFQLYKIKTSYKNPSTKITIEEYEEKTKKFLESKLWKQGSELGINFFELSPYNVLFYNLTEKNPIKQKGLTPLPLKVKNNVKYVDYLLPKKYKDCNKAKYEIKELILNSYYNDFSKRSKYIMVKEDKGIRFYDSYKKDNFRTIKINLSCEKDRVNVRYLDDRLNIKKKEKIKIEIIKPFNLNGAFQHTLGDIINFKTKHMPEITIVTNKNTFFNEYHLYRKYEERGEKGLFPIFRIVGLNSNNEKYKHMKNCNADRKLIQSLFENKYKIKFKEDTQYNKGIIETKSSEINVQCKKASFRNKNAEFVLSVQIKNNMK